MIEYEAEKRHDMHMININHIKCLMCTW